MFRRIRYGIVTALAMAVLLAPAAWAQTDAVKNQLDSAVGRARTFKKPGKLSEAEREYEQALELARRELGHEHQTTSATEAKAIEPKLQAYAHSKPIVYTDHWDLEAVFRAFRQPRVVLLSTHGFFLEDQKEDAGQKAGLALEGRETGRKPRVTSENPLLRCGLLPSRAMIGTQ